MAIIQTVKPIKLLALRPKIDIYHKLRRKHLTRMKIVRDTI